METIKKEKKADLEQLLNSLIEKGWKPRGLNIMGKIVIDYDIEFAFDIYDSLQKGHWNFRELASKESGLWQFVCENNLAPIMCTEEWIKHYYEDIDEDNLISGENIQPTTEYEYRLIESSLKDESELEDFLLSNIKVGG